MKIIHCADIHADSAMESHFDKKQKESRKEEIVNAFARMVDFAAENDVKAVIIAGDLFDTKAAQQKTIKNRIARLITEKPQIDFLYLRGNHDEDSDFFSQDNIPNLKLFSKDEWKSYSFDDDKIRIVGREFTSAIPVSAYSQLGLDSTKVNIVVMHGQTADYKTKNDAPDISLPKLANRNIDYIALGHIHEYRLEKLDHRGVWCYSGCLEGRGFDECGQKGFVLLNIEDGKLSSKFIPNSQRIIHDVRVGLEGSLDYNQILEKIEEKLSKISSEDIVKITLQGEVSEDTEIEAPSYQAHLASRFFYLQVRDKCENIIDYKEYENDVSLKGEFIRLVKEQKNLSDSEKSKIIMTGIKALAGRNF